MSIPVTTDRPVLLHSGADAATSADAAAPAPVVLSATPDTVLWGRLPGRDDLPVVRLRSGEGIVVDTVSHEGIMPDQGGDPIAFFAEHGGLAADEVLQDTVAIAASVPRSAADGPHVVTGPIAVEGARPGDLLAVTIESLELRAPYGVVSTRHGRGVLHGEASVDGSYSAFCDVVDVDGVPSGRIALHEAGTREPGTREAGTHAAGPHATFPLAPFLGIVGVAADVPGRPHSTPPGLHGGNLDIAMLTAGSTLFLPVQVADALLYVGDPHFAQGDGEVALTALEAPLRATLRVEVVPAAEAAAMRGVTGPFAVAHGMLVPVGLSENLELALRRCVRNAIAMLTSLVDVDEHRAYLYLSAAADFSVSQAVDIVKGVHGAIRLADFADLVPGPFTDRILAAAARSTAHDTATEGTR